MHENQAPVASGPKKGDPKKVMMMNWAGRAFTHLGWLEEVRSAHGGGRVTEIRPQP